MMIKTILNNNAVIAIDENEKEVVIVKNGIGFNSKKGMVLKDNDMEKVFILQEKNVSDDMIHLLSLISEEYIEVSKKIVDYGRTVLKTGVHDSIYVTLSDHIELAVSRKKKGIAFDNAMTWSIKKTYREEYHIGEGALKIIQIECGVTLPEEEAGLIALHFVNAKIHNEPEVTHDFAYISVFVQDLINFIKYFLCTEMDENSLEYNQLLSYLQTLALVLDDRKAAAVSSDSRYYEMLRYAKGYFKRAYDCSDRIRRFTKEKYDLEIQPEDILHLTMYINKFIKKE